jgi:hypothetical protein
MLDSLEKRGNLRFKYTIVISSDRYRGKEKLYRMKTGPPNRSISKTIRVWCTKNTWYAGVGINT